MTRLNGAGLGLLAWLILAIGCAAGPEAMTSSTGAAESAATAAQPEFRAVWVSILGPGLRSEAEIKDMVAAVRRANLNTIIAQVRREGATIYPSEIEPRHAAVRGTPDFDPLATLLREARDTSGGKKPIAVHAWFNTFAMGAQKDYIGRTPKPMTEQHPDWFTRDDKGQKQEELDPGVPGVQDHTIAVIEECLKKYDVDGVNLDYVRYYEADRGYNPVALARFQKLTGRTDKPEPNDEAWGQFRRDQVTNMVRRVAAAVWTHRPRATFSVDATAYGGPGASWDRSAPWRQVFQDWAGWAERGQVDWVARMGYKRHHIADHAQQFRDWADFSKALQDRSGVQISLGIGGYFNYQEKALEQYREAQKRGLGTCLFSYNQPTEEARNVAALRDAKSPLWNILGTEIYPEFVPPPAPDWRGKLGTLAGRALDPYGSPIDGADVKLTSTSGDSTVISGVTDGSGVYVITRIPPEAYHAIIGQTNLPEPLNIRPGVVTWVE